MLDPGGVWYLPDTRMQGAVPLTVFPGISPWPASSLVYGMAK